MKVYLVFQCGEPGSGDICAAAFSDKERARLFLGMSIIAPEDALIEEMDVDRPPSGWLKPGVEPTQWMPNGKARA